MRRSPRARLIEDAGTTKAEAMLISGRRCHGRRLADGGFLGLKVRHTRFHRDGGCSYLIHLAMAAEAIRSRQMLIALITLAGNAPGPCRRARRRRGRFEARLPIGATTN